MRASEINQIVKQRALDLADYLDLAGEIEEEESSK